MLQMMVPLGWLNHEEVPSLPPVMHGGYLLLCGGLGDDQFAAEGHLHLENKE